MTARTKLREAQPDLYQAVLDVSQAADKAATDAGLSGLLTELVKLRVSQLNGCAFCLRHHTRDAMAKGEQIERLAVLPAWRETAYFDPAEREALELAELFTLIATPHRPDYVTVPAALGPDQVAAVTWVVIAINTLNRVAMASGYHVGRPT